MAHRKLAQDMEKVFKKVAEGVTIFDSIYEKIQECENQSQKEKLEDSLKKEIKKLQRLRDDLKKWAGDSAVKDKKPLLDNRKLIETKMELFKAVEKEMKTKAFSKEGLAISAKKDPREQEKEDCQTWVNELVDDLNDQINECRTKIDEVGPSKKGKKAASNDAKKQELVEKLERHEFHEGKLQQLLRALDNDKVEPSEVEDQKKELEYYVKENTEPDFVEDDTVYDQFDLEFEDNQAVLGLNTELDKVSSHDAQSIPDEPAEHDTKPTTIGQGKQKAAAIVESITGTGRRPSTQLKSPLPVLATLNTIGSPAATTVKPAPAPVRQASDMRYASAAANATKDDKNGIGIMPLPPGPGAAPSATGQAAPSLNTVRQPSVGASPHSVSSIPVQQRTAASTPQIIEASLASRAARSPAPSHTSHTDATADVKPQGTHLMDKQESTEASKASPKTAGVKVNEDDVASAQALPNGNVQASSAPDTESVYHLPVGLEDILEAFEAAKADADASLSRPVDERSLAVAHASKPDSIDAERPRHYKPQNPYPYIPDSYPHTPLAIFDDPRLYTRIETDALFYAFYYRQGSYQQYLAAKALKAQSWRFHKQYQTWFQRHEEPKAITEEFEQGTYRFFDYESTWMNRRKADFKFAYKFLEDDL